MNCVISPTGVAIHTRNYQGQDYSWCVKQGGFHLFEEMANIHRLVMRDIGDNSSPRLSIIIQNFCLGFLIGDMPSERYDFQGRNILTTLYLEVIGAKSSTSILKLVANLLTCSQEQYRSCTTPLLEYAEELYQTGYPATRISPITLDTEDIELDESVIKTLGKNVALYSISSNRKRCANYLSQLTLPIADSALFCFVSTGEVNIEECQQVAKYVDQCILLTLSPQLLIEIDIKSSTIKELLQEQFSKLSSIRWYLGNKS